jgi:hypothetical protein
MGEFWGELVGLSLRDPSWPRTRPSQVYGVIAGVLVMCALGASIGYLVARPDLREGPATVAEDAAGGGAERAPATERSSRPDTPLITNGVTVQVLNATGGGRAGAHMAARLRRLGYHVVVINDASVPYDRTTVMWSRPPDKEAAAALAARFGWEARRKPGNLSGSVTTHVVVGRDEA